MSNPTPNGRLHDSCVEICNRSPSKNFMNFELQMNLEFYEKKLPRVDNKRDMGISVP